MNAFVEAVPVQFRRQILRAAAVFLATFNPTGADKAVDDEYSAGKAFDVMQAHNEVLLSDSIYRSLPNRDALKGAFAYLHQQLGELAHQGHGPAAISFTNKIHRTGDDIAETFSIDRNRKVVIKPWSTAKSKETCIKQIEALESRLFMSLELA
jgi:hypothetical protein